MTSGTRRVVAALAFGVSLGRVPVVHADTAACVAAAEHGQRWQKAGHLTGAARYFSACSDAACPLAVRNDCRQWADEVQRQLSSIVVDAKDGSGHDVADVEVSIDDIVVTRSLDGRAIPVDPGPHRFLFKRDGSYSVYEEAIIKEGVKNRLFDVRFITNPPSTEERVAPAATPSAIPYIVGGVGVAAITAGTIFIVAAPSQPSNCKDGSTCDYPAGKTSSTYNIAVDEKNASAHQTDTTAGVIVLGAGVAAVATGVVWWLVERSHRPSSPASRLRMTPLLERETAGVGLRGTF